MTDRPILFSAPMVRALLAGTKTQTRRVMNPQPSGIASATRFMNASWTLMPESARCSVDFKAPRFAIGDRLYVREAWRCNGWATDVATIMYRASEGDGYTAMTEQYPVKGKKPLRTTGTWHPGLHMPRWASRLTLTVTEVRVQRIQEISAADAQEEGVERRSLKVRQIDLFGADAQQRAYIYLQACRWEYEDLWNHLNAARGYGWATNPWVVAVSFSVARRNIDTP